MRCNDHFKRRNLVKQIFFIFIFFIFYFILFLNIFHNFRFNIEPVECLNKNFENPENSPHLTAMIHIFNKFQEWGAAQVMLAQNQGARVEVAVNVK